MPLKLTIWVSPTSDTHYDFEFDNEEIVVGRDPACDVQLPFSFVSGHHFTIISEGSSYLIADNGSTNGTVVNGTRLAPQTYNSLTAGDIISVGDVMMQGEMIDVAENTLTLEESSEEVRRMVHEALTLRGKNQLPVLEVTSGASRGKKIEITEDIDKIIIGSGADVDFVLEDDAAHQEHLALVRRGQGFIAQPLNEQLTRIDGNPLVEDVGLGREARLTVGNTKLRFVDPLQRYLDELARMPDDTSRANAGAEVLSTQQIDTVTYDDEAEPGPEFGPPDRPPIPGRPRLFGTNTDNRAQTVEEEPGGWGTFEYLVIAVTAAVVLGGIAGILILFNVIKV